MKDSELVKGESTVPEATVPQLSMTTVFEDPTNGRISNGFLKGVVGILMETEIESRFKQEAYDVLILVGMKMASLYNIKASYIQSLEAAKDSLRSSHKDRGLARHDLHSTELMGWTDVYLVQIKSTLDHLVKVPTPVLGKNRWLLRTFGERGAKVKKALDNLPNKDKEKLTDCYESIFGSQPWIEDMIEMRDRLNHGIRGGGDPKDFRVSYNAASNTFTVPMWNGEQELSEALNICFDELLTTCSIFCATIFELRLPENKIAVCDRSIRSVLIPICKLEDKAVFQLRDQLRRAGSVVAE